jgi:hypothetical protein
MSSSKVNILARTALHRAFQTSLLAVTTASAACQGSADVKMAFDNRAAGRIATQALVLSESQTPTVFGIKMTAVYLVEDVDATSSNNVGEVGRIWTNPVCDEGLHECGIAPTMSHRVSDFFDLALPTDEVNRRLNAQGQPLKPGTYRYLRLDLTGPLPADVPNDPHLTNLRFGAGGVVSEVRNPNNAYTVRIDPPLQLADGDSATVALGYDYRSSYYPDPAANGSQPPEGTNFQDWLCSDLTHAPARGPCLRFTGFSPSVSAK